MLQVARSPNAFLRGTWSTTRCGWRILGPAIQHRNMWEMCHESKMWDLLWFSYQLSNISCFGVMMKVNNCQRIWCEYLYRWINSAISSSWTPQTAIQDPVLLPELDGKSAGNVCFVDAHKKRNGGGSINGWSPTWLVKGKSQWMMTGGSLHGNLHLGFQCSLHQLKDAAATCHGFIFRISSAVAVNVPFGVFCNMTLKIFQVFIGDTQIAKLPHS